MFQTPTRVFLCCLFIVLLHLLLLLLLKVCIYVLENWIRSLLMFCFAVVVVYFSLVASVCFPSVETCHSVFSKLLNVLFLLYLLFVFLSFHEDWVRLVVFDCGWGLRLAVCVCFWWSFVWTLVYKYFVYFVFGCVFVYVIEVDCMCVGVKIIIWLE